MVVMPNDADTLATFKACACGLTHSEPAWLKLPLVGHCDDGDGGVLEMRNCACGSTIAVVCDAFPVADTMPAPPPDFAATLAGFTMMVTQHEGCQS